MTKYDDPLKRPIKPADTAPEWMHKIYETPPICKSCCTRDSSSNRESGSARTKTGGCVQMLFIWALILAACGFAWACLLCWVALSGAPYHQTEDAKTEQVEP